MKNWLSVGRVKEITSVYPPLFQLNSQVISGQTKLFFIDQYCIHPENVFGV